MLVCSLEKQVLRFKLTLNTASQQTIRDQYDHKESRTTTGNYVWLTKLMEANGIYGI